MGWDHRFGSLDGSVNLTGRISISVEDLALVVSLAAQIDDRDRAEHKALARVAAKVDNARNHGSLGNVTKRGYVEHSSLLSEVGIGHLPKKDRERWERQIERWYQTVEFHKIDARRVAEFVKAAGA